MKWIVAVAGVMLAAAFLPSPAEASCVFLKRERVMHNGMYYGIENNCNYPVVVKVRIGQPGGSTYVGRILVRGYTSTGHFSFHYEPRIVSYCRLGTSGC